VTLVWRPGFAYDTDASAYIDAVEVADGQALETATRYAINDFVIGCKQDSIWSAIKASCILSGARTFAGALVPLAGTAPTNFNFVSGDYNRKTGLLGNGSNKYLDSNRNNNADPQDSQHLAVHCTVYPTPAPRRAYIGCGVGDNGSSQITSEVNNITGARCRSSSVGNSTSSTSVGLIGINRNASANFTIRAAGNVDIFAVPSQAPLNQTINVFARGLAGPVYTNARLAFYSIGESLDLALLDTRVSTLIAQFGAVIP
jgi:hypothetical protein